MSRKRSQQKPNPPQIHIFTEGYTEKYYLELLRQHVNIKGRKQCQIFASKKQGIAMYHEVQKKYSSHNFVVSPIDIYLVMDKDDISEGEIKDVKKRCDQSQYDFIYSNESFELWLLLHFERVSRYYNRAGLKRRLEDKFGGEYKKTDKKLLKEIAEKYCEAIKNSDNFPDSPDGMLNHNPYTNFRKLIISVFDTECN